MWYFTLFSCLSSMQHKSFRFIYFQKRDYANQPFPFMFKGVSKMFIILYWQMLPRNNTYQALLPNIIYKYTFLETPHNLISPSPTLTVSSKYFQLFFQPLWHFPARLFQHYYKTRGWVDFEFSYLHYRRIILEIWY